MPVLPHPMDTTHLNQKSLINKKLQRHKNDETIHKMGMNGSIFKRLFDFCLALGGGLFFLPLGLLIAICIKLEDGGPVFFLQERWGKGGKIFLALKFRSMIQDADKVAGFKPAEVNDPRVTKVGKVLRATAMDELPQLINIIKGDMSFVGPRALAIKEITPETEGFEQRHRIQPGLTGPAQVYAPKDASLQEKFAYDFQYIQKQNPLYDLKLICLSGWVTLLGKWESRQKKI